MTKNSNGEIVISKGKIVIGGGLIVGIATALLTIIPSLSNKGLAKDINSLEQRVGQMETSAAVNAAQHDTIIEDLHELKADIKMIIREMK